MVGCLGGGSRVSRGKVYGGKVFRGLVYRGRGKVSGVC